MCDDVVREMGAEALLLTGWAGGQCEAGRLTCNNFSLGGTGILLVWRGNEADLDSGGGEPLRSDDDDF